MRFWYIWTQISGFRRKLEYTYHLLRYGVSPHEIWNLDNTIAEFVLPRLKLFRLNCGGMPYSTELERHLTMEEWESVLDDMIYFFEQEVEKYHNYDYDRDRYKKGKSYFCEYFGALWN